MHRKIQAILFPILTILAVGAVIVTLVKEANAADAIFLKGGKQISKLEAIRDLAISNNKDSVLKCTPVKLDEDKGTIKSK